MDSRTLRACSCLSSSNGSHHWCSLAEAEGFALAGGGALIAHEVVDRTTRDLDCFGPSRVAVDRLWPAIRDRLLSEGLEVDVNQSDHGFAKMSVTDPCHGRVHPGRHRLRSGHARGNRHAHRLRAVPGRPSRRQAPRLVRQSSAEGLRRRACTTHPLHSAHALIARSREGSRLQPRRSARCVRCARRSAAQRIRGERRDLRAPTSRVPELAR